jgi:hypothetical protein
MRRAHSSGPESAASSCSWSHASEVAADSATTRSSRCAEAPPCRTEALPPRVPRPNWGIGTAGRVFSGRRAQRTARWSSSSDQPGVLVKCRMPWRPARGERPLEARAYSASMAFVLSIEGSSFRMSRAPTDPRSADALHSQCRTSVQEGQRARASGQSGHGGAARTAIVRARRADSVLNGAGR